MKSAEAKSHAEKLPRLTATVSRSNPIDKLLIGILSLFRFYINLLQVFTQFFFGLIRLRSHEFRYTMETVVHQIIFSGIDAFYVVGAIAAMVGGVVMVQLIAFSTMFESEAILMQILVSIIIRELAPLLTSLILIARSGSAIAIELGVMQLKHQDDTLDGMEIDMIQFFHVPRVIGLTFSNMILVGYFVIITLGSALAISLFREGIYMGPMLANFIDALKLSDILVCIIKAGILGMVIALVCIYHGSQVKNSTTEIPQQTSQALVNSYLLCYKFTVAISVVAYLVQ